MRNAQSIAHGVIRFCSDDVFCPPKKSQKHKGYYSLGVWAESEMTKIFQLALGNESLSPVDHKSFVHSGIELLVII